MPTSPEAALEIAERFADDHHHLCASKTGGECDCYAASRTEHVLARALIEEQVKTNYLVRRVENLAHALDRAITTLEHQGDATLLVKELRRVFYDEAVARG